MTDFGKGEHLVSEENKAPEDVQPLARSVSDQQLARPVGEEQEEAQPEVSQEPEVEHQEAGPEEEQVEERGPIGKAADKASEKGLVDESTVERAEEKGLIDKAEEMIDKIKDKLTGR